MSEGGNSYGSPNLPCELGSGTEGPHESYGHVAGGGMIGKHFCRTFKFQKEAHNSSDNIWCFYVSVLI